MRIATRGILEQMVVRKGYWMLSGDGEVAWKYEMEEGEEEKEGAFYGCSVIEGGEM